jgi:hypothetical protein
MRRLAGLTAASGSEPGTRRLTRSRLWLGARARRHYDLVMDD